MSFYAISALVNFIAAFIFGGLVFFNEPRSRIHQLFGLLGLVTGAWSLFYFLWQISDCYEDALLYTQLLTLFAIFIPTISLHWVYELINDKTQIMKYVITFFYLSSGLLASLSFTNLLVNDIMPFNSFEWWPQAGPLYGVYIIFFTLPMIPLTIIAFKKAYTLDKNNDERRKYLFVAISLVLGFLGGATNFFLWYQISIPPVGNILITSYLIVMWYVVIRFNFLKNSIFTTTVFVIVVNIVAFIQVLMSQEFQDFLFNFIFFVLVAFISYTIKKNIDIEVERNNELLKKSNELKRANKELRRLDKAKSEFISIASHQLRTPLTVIKGYISLILEGAYSSDEEKTREALKNVFSASERLVHLVEDLLNITRIEAGSLQYEPEGIDIKEILKELKSMFALKAQEKKLDFSVELPKQKLPLIYGDKVKLYEVISNIVDNAIKYTQRGFVKIMVEQDNKILRIIVEDSGIGISKDLMKKLFVKFSRGSDSVKFYTEGTGLGLYVGKNLVEMQGGRIYAKSEGVGKGSKFVIEMPIM
jgi:signal transduction histidine kinase